MEHSLFLNPVWTYLSLTLFLVSEWQNSKIQKKQLGSEQGSLEMGREHGTGKCRQAKYFGMSRGTHRKSAKESLMPSCIVALSVLTEWTPQHLGCLGLVCVPSRVQSLAYRQHSTVCKGTRRKDLLSLPLLSLEISLTSMKPTLAISFFLSSFFHLPSFVP